MIAELVSSALGLALYLNTLSADFCYDDRLTQGLWHLDMVHKSENITAYLDFGECEKYGGKKVLFPPRLTFASLQLCGMSKSGCVLLGMRKRKSRDGSDPPSGS
ncbi:hypothetical protein STEG23_022472 [Scotinomys teguina]